MTKHEWPKQKDGSLKPMRELTRNQQREQFDFAMERLAKEFAPLGIEVVNGEKEKDHMN